METIPRGGRELPVGSQNESRALVRAARLSQTPWRFAPGEGGASKAKAHGGGVTRRLRKRVAGLEARMLARRMQSRPVVLRWVHPGTGEEYLPAEESPISEAEELSICETMRLLSEDDLNHLIAAGEARKEGLELTQRQMAAQRAFARVVAQSRVLDRDRMATENGVAAFHKFAAGMENPKPRQGGRGLRNRSSGLARRRSEANSR